MKPALGSVVCRRGTLARLCAESDSEPDDADVLPMEEMAAALEDIQQELPAYTVVNASEIAVNVAVDVYRLRIRAHIVDEPVMCVPGPIEGLTPDDLDLIGLLLTSETDDKLTTCDTVTLYERAWLVAAWADCTSPNSPSVVGLFQDINGQSWKDYLREAYADPGMRAVVNAAQLRAVLAHGYPVTPPTKQLTSHRSAPEFKTKRKQETSSDSDADEPVLINPPLQLPSEQEVFAAEKALSDRTTAVGLCLVDRYTYQEAIVNNALLVDFLDTNHLWHHIDVLRRDNEAHDVTVEAVSVKCAPESGALKVSKIIDDLTAEGKIQPQPPLAAPREVWEESASVFSHRQCGVVWPSPMEIADVRIISDHIKRAVWTCTLRGCLAVLDELVHGRQADRQVIKSIAARARQIAVIDECCHWMHVERFKQITSALGVLDKRSGRLTAGKGRPAVMCTYPNGTYDDLHSTLSFYVHIMSNDIINTSTDSQARH